MRYSKSLGVDVIVAMRNKPIWFTTEIEGIKDRKG